MLGFETIITGALTVIIYVLVLVAIYRIFQISGDVREMKETLKGIRSGAVRTQPGAAAVPSPDSAEALVRAVHAASWQEIDDSIAEAQRKEP